MATQKIHIFDTTLRDGEQVPGCKLNQHEKLVIARQLETLGVDVIEAGFPVSSPGDFAAVAAIAAQTTEAAVCALTRAVEHDIRVAGEALRPARRARIHTGIGTSDLHVQQKLRTTRADVLERAVAAVKLAKSFVEDVEFYAEDAGRTDNEFLARVCEAVIAAGATVLNIPDTTGYCLPHEYGAKISYLAANVRGIERAMLSTHCHNDLGVATANSIAGAMNGARQIECTINGVGERAGNTALEEVVMILRQHAELRLHTDVNPRLLTETSALVAHLMSMPVQANKAIVGSNAFAHSSGIHQDGFIKCRETYEIINPREVGAEDTRLVLTARSGRAALAYRLQKLGYELERPALNTAYASFLLLADRQREVGDDDLHQLILNVKDVADVINV